MRQYKFSRHALDMIDERGFDIDEVIEAVLRPEQTYISHARYGADVYIHQWGEIAVAVNRRSGVVITVLHRQVRPWGRQAPLAA
jgi:phage gp45-like